MAISLSQLSNASRAYAADSVSKSANQARPVGVKTAFLCHSHADATYAKGMANLLYETGWRIYIDWLDAEMPQTPNRVTAQKIKDRIQAANYFLFLATPNSVKSRWCPWEIGYADGVKPIQSIFVIPTFDSNGNYGNEYLQLYRTIEFSSGGDLSAWEPGQNQGGVRVSNL